MGCHRRFLSIPRLRAMGSVNPTAIAARLTLYSALDALQGAIAAGLLGGGSRFPGVTEDPVPLLPARGQQTSTRLHGNQRRRAWIIAYPHMLKAEHPHIVHLDDRLESCRRDASK